MEAIQSSGGHVQAQPVPASASVHQGIIATHGSLSVGNITFNNTGIPSHDEPNLIGSLWFDGMNLRQFSVKNADADTCQWLLEQDQYLEWKNGDIDSGKKRLLWIKGVAGAGKSTLMKYAINHETEAEDFDLVLYHFFDAQGKSSLMKSTEGMYRTLLVQILSELPGSALQKLEPSKRDLESRKWPLEKLIQLLKLALHEVHGKRVAFYIDALDECDEDEMRQMVRALEALVLQSESLRVCFSSRPYPHVTARRASILDLSLYPSHVDSTHKYIRAHLEIGDGSIAQEVEKDLIQKSGGVFLWVCLVVSILNREFDRGRVHSLRERLRQVPRDLQQLYTDILARDEEDSLDRLICFQALMTADGLPSVEELWWRIQLGRQEKLQTIIGLYKELQHDDMARYIVDITRGLVHCFQGLSHNVRFVHESVREYGLEHNGFSSLETGTLQSTFVARSHSLMARCCSRLVSAELIRWVCEGQPHPVDFEALTASLSRRSYRPWGTWHRLIGDDLWRHAEGAQAGGIDQADWLRRLDLRVWVTMMGIFEKYYDYDERPAYTPRYRSQTSLLFVLMAKGCENLVTLTQPAEILEASRFGLLEGPELWQTATNAALVQGRRGSLRAMFSLCLQHKGKGSILRPYLEQLANNEVEYFRRGLHPAGGPLPYSQGLLNIAGASEGVALFYLLIFIPHGLLRELNHENLLEAAKEGFAVTLQFMLDHSVTSDALRLAHPDTLKWAMNKEHGYLAATLRKHGVSMEETESTGEMEAWGLAIENGRQELQGLVEKYRT